MKKYIHSDTLKQAWYHPFDGNAMLDPRFRSVMWTTSFSFTVQATREGDAKILPSENLAEIRLNPHFNSETF